MKKIDITKADPEKLGGAIIMMAFKYEKNLIEKKLDTLINKKFSVIEKKCKKLLGTKNKANPNASLFIGNGYVGSKNKEGLPHGIGNILYKIGDTYAGESKYGLRHGIGKYTYLETSNKAYHPFNIPDYTGEWFADTYYGLGKKVITDFKDLMIYEGYFANDKITGFGIYKNKSTNSELIGYFYEGQGIHAIVEIHRGSKEPSGLFEYDIQKGTKKMMQPIDLQNWDSIKDTDATSKGKSLLSPHKLLIKYFPQYKGIFGLEVFTKKFKDFKFKLKKELVSLMCNVDKYFINNSKNKVFFKFLENINDLNKFLLLAASNDNLILAKKEIKKFSKEFSELKKDLIKP